MQTDRTSAVLADRYVLEQELGRSGVAIVWRAADRVLERTVAVELIHPDLGDDPAFVERWTEDARVLARISDPHLTRLLDTGNQDGVRFVVREFVPGETLRERLTRVGRLAPAHAAAVAVSVLAALEVLHDHGLLHLDVRPETVLLAEDDRVLLRGAAFAPAVIVTRTPAEATAYLGEEAKAPELVEGTPPNASTDVYGAGALLYEMLAGAPPPSTAAGPRAIEKRVPRPIDLAVRRALAAEPTDRFATATAFARALELHTRPRAGLSRVSGTAADSPTPPNPTPSWLRTWLLVPLGVLVTAAIVITIGLFVGTLEIGGPLGIRAAPGEPPSAPRVGVLRSPPSRPRTRSATGARTTPARERRSTGTTRRRGDPRTTSTDGSTSPAWASCSTSARTGSSRVSGSRRRTPASRSRWRSATIHRRSPIPVGRATCRPRSHAARSSPRPGDTSWSG